VRKDGNKSSSGMMRDQRRVNRIREGKRRKWRKGRIRRRFLRCQRLLSKF